MIKKKFRKFFIFFILFLFIGANIIPLSGNKIILKLIGDPDQNNLNKVETEQEQIVVPDCVQVGDILLMDIAMDASLGFRQPGPHNEHSAIYVGNNSFVHADSGSKCVRTQNYSAFKGVSLEKNIAFVRVTTANNSTRMAAANWAKNKSDEIAGFQELEAPPWFVLKMADPDRLHPMSDCWYCMELVWASYYNQGIDIDRNGWKPDFLFYPSVYGDDIIYDDDTEIVYIENDNDIEIVKPCKGFYFLNKKVSSTIFGTFVFGDVEIVANMSDSENISRVNFYIDGEYKANDTDPPYIWKWADRSRGKRKIKVEAVPKIGENYSTFVSVTNFF